VLLRLYKSLVWPHLEYCISAWSPYFRTSSTQIYSHGSWIEAVTLRYDLRLQSLGLWPLEERQNRADLVEEFKLYKGWSTTSFDSMFTLSSNTQTRGHSAKLTKNSIRLELRHRAFSERVIDRWNRLDQQVIDSPSASEMTYSVEWGVKLYSLTHD